MNEPDPSLSYRAIAFSIGSDMVVITPTHMGADEPNERVAAIYCEISFSTGTCSGKCFDVFDSRAFSQFKAGLGRMIRRESASVAITGWSSVCSLEGNWDQEEGAAVFKLRVGHPVGPDDWCSTRKLSPQYWGNMNSLTEVVFSMTPDELEEPFVALEAILDQIRASRSAIRGPVDNSDIDDET
jgi:hypothetical protein